MKNEVFEQEKLKLKKIFKEVEPAKAELVEGLIDDAAFFKAENAQLKEILAETGMIKIHPKHRNIQKPVEAAKQYRQNVNSYSTVIKTLNGVLQKNAIEPEDPFDVFLKKKQEELGE